MAKSSSQRRLEQYTTRIGAVATAFETRWTMAAFRRVEPDMAARLHAAVAQWNSCHDGLDEGVIEKKGEALIRGYRRAIQIMEELGVPDSAYFVGKDPDTGLKVIIGQCPSQAAQACAAEGPDAIWMTADEVANLLPKLSGFSTLAAIKKAFPGALALADADRH